MLQRQPWLSGPGSVADTLAKALLAIHGEQPLGSRKVHAGGRTGHALPSEQEAVGHRQASRRGANALARFNRRRRG